MKALEKYVKKTGKEPYGKTKPKGKWEGSKGPQMKDQYAPSTGGRKVVDDTKDFDETDPETAGIGAYESVRGYTPKKKQRSYLSGD